MFSSKNYYIISIFKMNKRDSVGIFHHRHNHTLFQHNNGVWMQNNEIGKGTFQFKYYNKEFNIKHYKNGGFNGNIRLFG